MPVNSSRRVDMHAFVEMGVQVGLRLLVQLSWTTASRHGVVVHHRYKRARSANRAQPLQKVNGAEAIE